ncbi:restriction endonuclease subunit S [Psychrobacter sp. HY3-MNA-CIBAN-0198]|uniref:restriction endonuclease subunit S n=1 Tax=Psychrobacter sp. HY3-MNA-CIBAN-0198 TaxID=3140441 RepID=UPI003322398E
MKSNYKKLGNYIVQKGEPNKDLITTNLLGISNAKYFVKAKTNLNGIDLSKYRIVERNQFAFNRATTRNGDKISIALREAKTCIVSPSYRIFEVKNESELDPQYLMMWFRRPEFDRYARFKSHGSAHEFFDYEEMCDIELPIPSIDKQREIVREYNVVNNRIILNEKFNKKLEDTVQAIYTHWFVDFEFPISREYANCISKPELEGQPYKSSGGEMRYCEDLKQSIPIMWKLAELGQLSEIKAGGDRPKLVSDTVTEKCAIPIYSNSTENEGLYGYTNKPKINKKSITVSARGAIIGYTVLRLESFFPIVRLIVVTPNDEHLLNYVFESIKLFQFDSTASAQGQLTAPEMKVQKLLLPDSNTLNEYQKLTVVILNKIASNKNQNKTLRYFENILLKKLAKV